MSHREIPKAAYSIAEFCLALGIGRTTAFEAIKTGRIKALKVGTRTIIPAAEIRIFLEGLESRGRAE
jgi:excisionase family DNA binding protein